MMTPTIKNGFLAPDVEGVYIEDEGEGNSPHLYKYVVSHVRPLGPSPSDGDVFWVFEDGRRIAQVTFAHEELRVLPGGVLNHRQTIGAVTCIDKYLAERG